MQEIRAKRIGDGTRAIGLVYMFPDEPLLERACFMRESLTDSERAAGLAAHVMTFPADEAHRIILETFGQAGVPTGEINGRVIEEARFWARDANPAELKGYAQAALEALSKDGKRAVLAWLQKQIAEDTA